MTSRLALFAIVLAALMLSAWGLWARIDDGVGPPLPGASTQAPAPGAMPERRSGEVPGLSEVEGGTRPKVAIGDMPQPLSTVLMGGQPSTRATGGLPVRVLDRATGLPVEGMRAVGVGRLKRWIGFSEVLGHGTGVTDEHGHAEVQMPSRARFNGSIAAEASLHDETRLVLQGAGYAMAVRRNPLTVPRRGGRIDCYVERCAELRGRVAFATALEGRVQKVRLRQRIARWPSGPAFDGDLFGDGRIGPDGEFTVKDIPPGVPFQVEILAVGEVVWTLPDFLSVGSGEVRTVDWEIAPLTVRVQGVEQDFRAPRHHRVRLEPAPSGLVEEGSEQWSRANSQAAQLGMAGADGVTTFDGVLPGRWRATVVGERDLSGFPNPTPLTARPAPSFVDFNVGPGGGAVDVKLPIHRGFYIVGSLHGEDDLDVTGVTLYAEGDGGVHRQLDAPGASGPRFRIGPLVPGQYALGLKPPRRDPQPEDQLRRARPPLVPRTYAAGASSTSWSSLCVDPPVRATAGGDPVRVEVRAAGELELMAIDGASGLPVACEFVVSGRDAILVRAEGWWTKPRVKGLSGQPLVIHAFAGDGSAAVVLHPGVPLGEKAEPLVIKLRPPGTLRLTAAKEGPWRQFVARASGVVLGSVWLAPGATGELRVAAGAMELVEYTAEPGQPRRELTRQALDVQAGSTLRIAAR